MRNTINQMLAIKLAFLISICCILSCSKKDLLAKNEGQSIESKFFETNRSSNEEEKKIIEFLKRKNNQYKFVEKTVNQIGYPRWDKVVKQKQQTQLITNQSNATATSSDNNGTTNNYIIPFVRDSQNYVNATMVLTTTPTDTTINYLCDCVGSPFLVRNKSRIFFI